MYCGFDSLNFSNTSARLVLAFVDTEELSVFTAVGAALTSTDSDTDPIFSRTFSCWFCRDCNVTICSDWANPACATITRYWFAGRSGSWNCPSASATVVLEFPVLVSIAVITAPLIAAPDGSSTAPVIVERLPAAMAGAALYAIAGRLLSGDGAGAAG